MFHLCLLLLQLCWSFCISCNCCISKHLLHCLVIYYANRLCTAYDTLLDTIPAQYWGTATVQRQRTVHTIGGQEAWAQVLDVKQRVTHPLTGLCRQNPGFFFKFSCKILHSGAFLVRICAPWRLRWQGQHCYNHSSLTDNTGDQRYNLDPHLKLQGQLIWLIQWLHCHSSSCRSNFVPTETHLSHWLSRWHPVRMALVQCSRIIYKYVQLSLQLEKCTVLIALSANNVNHPQFAKTEAATCLSRNYCNCCTITSNITDMIESSLPPCQTMAMHS